ncbi:MAG: CoA-transferase [Pseudomonadota bacterium]
MSRERKKKLTTIHEAMSCIKDGAFLAIGGFMIHNHPMAIIREIVKQGIKGLKVLPTPPGGSIDVDLLIGSGCVASILASYVGGEWLQPVMPNYRSKAEKSELDIIEYDEHTIVCGLRAAIWKLPCEVTRAGLGTDLLKVNPSLKVFNNPITGEPLVAVPPIEPDVAIIHAQRADPYGNIQHAGSAFLDTLLASASKKVIVSVEEVVSLDDTRKDPFRTTIPCHLVTAVVELPFGAHPCSSHGYYTFDEDHIRKYVQCAGHPDRFQDYLNQYIYGRENMDDYLETIGGIKTLSDLRFHQETKE